MAPALTVKELFEVVRMSGSQASTPDFLLGYGIPNFTKVDIEATIHESVFPNPAVDEIFINVGISTDYPLISLMDSKGAVCSAPVTKINDRKYRLDISHQPASVYFLRFQQGHRYSIYKIIKIR